MATRADLTLYENNDEILSVEITAAEEGEDLSVITGLEMFLKVSPKHEDDDTSTLVLTSASASEIDITTQTTALITADIFIPGTELVAPYDRFWHLDAIGVGGSRRTALYGNVDVINL